MGGDLMYFYKQTKNDIIISKHKCKNELEELGDLEEITEEEFDAIVFPTIEQPKIKSQLEILQETVDALLINSLGGDIDV